MEERRVRICDIAEELGLSTATVSNVLHGKTKKISDETVRRVQALLEERQYIPSMAGILLAQNSSRIIGVVINDHEKYENHTLEDVFIAASLNHLSTEIEKNGQFMMVKKTRDVETIIRFASMWNLDGFVLIGFCNQDYAYLRSHMRIPFVVYDGYMNGADGGCGVNASRMVEWDSSERKSDSEKRSYLGLRNEERIYNITIDNYDGGYQVGTYFRECGHKKVLCIADNDICGDRERYEGVRAGFENADFLQIPMTKEQRWDFYRDNLPRLKSYTAIFAVSDYYAIDLIHFLNSQGISVPDEIAVAGFDDIPMCELVTPTLTSVHQDVALRAEIAIQKLKELREKKETEFTIRLPVQLVVRESTKKS